MTVDTRSARRHILSGASIICLSLLSVAPAQAQTAPATEKASDGSDIIVTASRRSELAKDVPVAVSAIAGEKLDVLNSSGLDIRFLSSRTPSLQVESSTGRIFPRFFIRGLGNTDFDANAAQPVSLVYDGVALENPLLKSFPVFDLENVQVLRGPQGTLFGRNTPAGVIQLTSAKPSNVFGGYASVQYGSYNTVNAEAAVGGPIAEGLDFRVSGLLQRRDNWVHNDTTSGAASRDLEGYRDIAGRAQLSYKSGDFTALLNFHARDLEGTPRVFRSGLFRQGSNNFSAGFTPDRVSLDGYTSQNLDQYGTSLNMSYHVDGIGTFYSVTGYEWGHITSIGDIDGAAEYGFPALGLNVALFPVNTGEKVVPKEFSQELRFASDPFDGFRLQGGAYYFRQRLNYDEYSYAAPYTGNMSGDTEQDVFHNDLNQNFGIFLAGEYALGSKLTLRAGARYSHDEKTDFVSGYGPSLTPGLNLPISRTVRASDVTWDASATYALTSNVNFYVRAATGYLGPAIQDRVTFGSVQNSAPKQTTLSFEGGFKGETSDHLLNFAISGYSYRTRDFQITAVGGASNSARLLSADHVDGSGAELEFGVKPLRHLSLSASGSYNFTAMRDPDIVVAVCGAMCTVTQPTRVVNGTTVAGIDGNPLPLSPRWIGTITGRYGVPLGNGDEVYFYTDWSYRSSINYFLYEAKEFKGRPLTEGGLKLGYQSHNGWEVSVYARNVLNQIRATDAIDFNNLTGMINEPRIVAGEFRVRF